MDDTYDEPAQISRNATSAAFFDLDRTLIAGASVYAFAVAAWRHNQMTLRSLTRDAASAIAFRLTGASDDKAEAVKQRVLAGVTGHHQDDLLAIGQDIVPRLLGKVRPESRALLELHQQDNRDTYVVSASPVEIVSEFASALNMTGAIATVSEVVDGVYTGELEATFCYGRGKAQRIEKLAAERGYDLRLSYAYSDSVSDLPMLETVGHPVAVNPDHALEAIARHRGWPIVEFARRAKTVVKATTAMSGAAGAAAGAYLLGRHHGSRAH